MLTQLTHKIAVATPFFLAVVSLAFSQPAEYPQWWFDRGVVAMNTIETNDYALVNQGQVKWIAANAYAELQTNGYGSQNLDDAISGFSSENGNYSLVNCGQLKHLASLFYDALGLYCPWAIAPLDRNDYDPVIIGETKYAFAFYFTGRDWKHISHNICASMLFSAFEARECIGVAGDEILSAQMFSFTFDSVAGDHIYISSQPGAAAGWPNSQGVQFLVGGMTFDLPADNSIRIPPQAIEEMGAGGEVEFSLIHNGMGSTIQLDQPVYMITWRPVLKLRDSGGAIVDDVVTMMVSDTKMFSISLDQSPPLNNWNFGLVYDWSNLRIGDVSSGSLRLSQESPVANVPIIASWESSFASGDSITFSHEAPNVGEDIHLGTVLAVDFSLSFDDATAVTCAHCGIYCSYSEGSVHVTWSPADVDADISLDGSNWVHAIDGDVSIPLEDGDHEVRCMVNGVMTTNDINIPLLNSYANLTIPTMAVQTNIVNAGIFTVNTDGCVDADVDYWSGPVTNDVDDGLPQASMDSSGLVTQSGNAVGTYEVTAHMASPHTCTITGELFIIKVDIAMDGNRDDTIDFDDPEDEEYLFWVNDDHDCLHYQESEWHEDDSTDWASGAPDPNCDDDRIGGKGYLGGTPPSASDNHCRRDLEDFTRLHLFVDDNTIGLPGITYHLKFESSGGSSPQVNVFEAVDTSISYLSDSSASAAQVQKVRLITVGTSEVPLDATYIVAGNQPSPFLIEGKSAGKGDLTFIVKKDGNEICRKSVELELKLISEFYNKYVVTTSTDDNVNSTSAEIGTCSYAPSVDEYVLFIHGWNVGASTKDWWSETVFKRLWWQGYRGHVGCFQWPTLGTLHYDRSEIRAWSSAEALKHRINALNSAYSGEVRIIAHSMGNVVAGESLRLFSSSVVHTYIAAQAALPGHCYDNSIPDYWTGFTTPNVYGFYYSGGSPSVPYFDGNSSKAGSIARYYNRDDWALDWWETNNNLKPDLNYHYAEGDGVTDTYNPVTGDRFYYDSIVPFDEYDLIFSANRYAIFARCAESRSRALGAVPTSIAGFSTQRDLQGAGMGYDGAHYSHSREFRSNIIDEWQFWTNVKNDFSLTGN